MVFAIVRQSHNYLTCVFKDLLVKKVDLPEDAANTDGKLMGGEISQTRSPRYHLQGINELCKRIQYIYRIFLYCAADE